MRMDIKDVVGLLVAIIIAIIGVSSIVIKIKTSKAINKNKINQTINIGDGNIQAGGNVNTSSSNRRE
jgi:hypothetical protein